jgi:hypothetical protein
VLPPFELVVVVLFVEEDEVEEERFTVFVEEDEVEEERFTGVRARGRPVGGGICSLLEGLRTRTAAEAVARGGRDILSW